MPKSRPWFCEPLWAAKSTVEKGPFKAPKGIDPEFVERMRAQHERDDKDADWIIWGTALDNPTEVTLPVSGGKGIDPGHGIVAKVRRLATFKEGVPHHSAFAQRIVECVNAMEGIDDPAGAMSRVRDFLREVAQDQYGGIDANDITGRALLNEIDPPSNRLLRRKP